MQNANDASVAAGAHVRQEFMDRVLWDAHDRRLSRLEDGYVEINVAVSQIQTKLEKNNELTSKIHDDTKEIRDMIAGARIFGKLAAWGGGISATIVSLYAVVELLSK